jgi:hypothetical protein
MSDRGRGTLERLSNDAATSRARFSSREVEAVVGPHASTQMIGGEQVSRQFAMERSNVEP